jgi:hypothetical protein
MTVKPTNSAGQKSDRDLILSKRMTMSWDKANDPKTKENQEML